MIAYSITNVKNFMAKLLTASDFYDFVLEEGNITTFNQFHIDGQLVKEFYSAEDWDNRQDAAEDFSSWEQIQPICFALIKGKNTPVSFQFVLHLKKEFFSKVLLPSETSLTDQDIKAFVLNIRFQQGKLTVTTGTAFHTFLLDKSADKLWDQYLKSFLLSIDISFEELL